MARLGPRPIPERLRAPDQVCRGGLRSPSKRVSSTSESLNNQSRSGRQLGQSPRQFRHQCANRAGLGAHPRLQWLGELAPGRQEQIEGGGPSDRVGCVRVLTLQDGVIRERLLEMSDLGHHYSYSILESRCRWRTTAPPCGCAASPMATVPIRSGTPPSIRILRETGGYGGPAQQRRVSGRLRCIEEALRRLTAPAGAASSPGGRHDQPLPGRGGADRPDPCANIAAHPALALRSVIDVDLEAARALAEPFGARADTDAEAALGDPRCTRC